MATDLRILENNNLICKLCNDRNYKIYKNGSIETLIQSTGKRSVTGNWRPLIIHVKKGYAFYKYDSKILAAHRIVYQKFNGDLVCGLEINHKDGNPLNNHCSNLEQVTKSENLQHSYDVLKRVINYGAAKINIDIAREIRNLHKDGKKFKQPCELFNLSKGTISYIVNNKTWIDNEVV